MIEREETKTSASSADGPRKSFRPPWSLIGILALAALLRFLDLGKESLWLDEVLSVNISHGGFEAIVRASIEINVMNLHPPLYHFTLYSWMLIFGESDLALRSLSAVFGTISVFLLYKVGTELFDRKTGLVAGLLLAISPFAIHYSSEVRPYSLLMLLTLASFLFFTRILKPDRRHTADLLGYCVANVLLVYTHAYGLFVLGAQVVYFFVFRTKYMASRRSVWIAQAVTALAALPWIYLLLSRGGEVVATQDPRGVADLTEQFLNGLLSDIWGLEAGAVALLLSPFLIALFLAGLLRLTRRGVRILVGRPRTLLLLLWIFIPLVGAVSMLLVLNSLQQPRYLIGIVPAVYIVAARGMANISEAAKVYVTKKNIEYALLAFVVLLCLPQLLTIYALPQREQWRQVADLIEQESLADDAVLCPLGYLIPFSHYYKADSEVATYGAAEDNGELAALLDDATDGKERLWVIVMQYQGTINAPTKEHLSELYGSDSLVIEEDFRMISLYLIDL